jgi:segregation and condensation protein B
VTDATPFPPPSEAAGDYSTPVSSPASAEAPLGLAARIEGLLFTSSGAVGLDQLAAALQVPAAAVEQAVLDLEAELKARGIRLQRHNSRVQLTTAPELADEVERLLGLESTVHLTRAALEVLAIVAYQQPVTRPQIDAVRGVNSESALHTLVHHGLVEETGRSDGPGRPILYVSTPDFLQRFGLGSVKELPPLEIPPAAAPPSAEPTAEEAGAEAGGAG